MAKVISFLPQTFISYLTHSNIVLHANRKPWIKPNPNYDPNKPFHFKFNNPNSVDICAHDKDLVENWNKIVNKNDIVYILGDFAYKNHRDHILSLNGNKILIKGNHDKMSQDCYNLMKDISEIDGFLQDCQDELGKACERQNIFNKLRKECHSYLKQYKNDTIDMLNCSDNIIKTVIAKLQEMQGVENIDQMTPLCYNLFTGVHEMGVRKEINQIDITLSHYAMRTWASSIHGAYHLYGHSHGRLCEPKGMLSFDVGVDVWDYAPIPWEVVVEKMKRIKLGTLKPIDGEQIKNLNEFDQKVMENRRNNYAILKDLGIPIKYPEMINI